MLKTLVPIVLAAMVLGVVTGIAAVMILFLGQDWDDALFFDLRRDDDRSAACSS